MKSLAVILLAVALVSPASAAVRATITLTSTDPLTVAGVRFQAREVVRVIVTAGDTRRVKTVRATSTGAFRARFALSVVDRCKVRASATGTKGSRAVWRPTHELCGIDLQPVAG